MYTILEWPLTSIYLSNLDYLLIQTAKNTTKKQTKKHKHIDNDKSSLAGIVESVIKHFDRSKVYKPHLRLVIEKTLHNLKLQTRKVIDHFTGGKILERE